MALNVKITHPDGSGSGEYSIMASNVDHSITRMPTQAPLPGDTGAGEYPEILFLDLGMMTEQITITGVLDDTDSPTKSNIRDVAALWWKENLEGTPKYITLTIESGDAYYGGIKHVSMKKESQQDYWNFSMVFVVQSKV